MKNDRSDRFEIIPAVGCFSADRRVSVLLKLWLLEKRVIDQWHFEKPLTQYKITDLWLATDVLDVKPPKTLPKPKKTIEESIVKKECKEHIPPIKPTTFIGKLQYMYEVWKSL